MEITIVPETPAREREVENLNREAFWNLHVPGCDEHYLVHCLRTHPDFVPGLNFVALHRERVVGSIMYTRSKLTADNGRTLDTLTFGPLCVLPEFHNRGIGSALIGHTFGLVREMGCPAVIILGHPKNYCRHGFVNGRDLHVSDAEGRFPLGLLVREMAEGALAGGPWRFRYSPVYELDAAEAERFDATFPPKEKGYRWTQTEFSMVCRAHLD